jgi:hypothetical protein
MRNSLYDKLKAIKEYEAATGEDAMGKRREQIESFRIYPIVDQAVRGESSVPEGFDRVLEKIGRWRHFYPHVLSQEDIDEARQYVDVLGIPIEKEKSEASDLVHLVANPVSVGGLAVAVASLFRLSDKNVKKMDRRDFLQLSALLTGVASFASIYGSNYLSLEPVDIEGMKKAEYVQEDIDGIYRPSRASGSAGAKVV